MATDETIPTRVERVRRASLERREQQRESLRRTILAAAGQLFLERGYENFSMRQVAERIGYSATTIYRYYEDKDDLLFEVVYEGFVEFGNRLRQAAASSEDHLERLEALGRAYVKFGIENPVYYQLMFMQRGDFLFESRKERTQPMRDSFDVLQQVVGDAMEAGVLKKGDIQVYSHAIWAVVHGIASLAVTGDKNFTPELVEASTAVAIQMVQQGLRP
jgi:AcrR family transcriptional regulator